MTDATNPPRRPWILAAIMSLALTGCAPLRPPPSVPKDYQGETAVIKDTATRIHSGKAYLFYVAEIDGKPIMNSLFRTERASFRTGNQLNLHLLHNDVPLGPHKFTIVGRATYAMPLLSLFDTAQGKAFEIKGEIEFSPAPDGKYLVKGSLSEERLSVWIENAKTGVVVGKVEETPDSN